mmetsp:Transcript_37223/g.42496  ORF Transcript_37223/g.42496 Transcript_37223/m.42496 type:complete len:426 (+) Transcript_37223:41-1318(+)|eukprot:CAMPEP_0194145914 /NCGR_PEP_ID=MMETSP0152-20130528/18910_1 /TAXON_ID=1049557 /ORGANISM="Thalassiothrix antarctica, Strain L6-D1" /LENGTH=425 /DNA_ID=CAMNT_0038846283 /DNA_START=40 /DNA_END=1317 /DNA_ORIENTATION=-
MSKPFDYSKWDNIELSDDEEDLHPNIDKESWFRMKHRSRVEREANDKKENEKLLAETLKANQRIRALEHELNKLVVIEDNENDGADDDLDDREGLEAEVEELKKANLERSEKLEAMEKNKKWNVDNMCQVKEERTIINSKAAETNFTPTGYAKSKDDQIDIRDSSIARGGTTETSHNSNVVATSNDKPKKENTVHKAPKTAVGPKSPDLSSRSPSSVSMDTYHDFTVKYADIVEEFMHMNSLDRSKEFLMKHGDILLQENASNYLLLASLEDEMNGYRSKMKLTCRQSQLISNITELAKSMKTHPGNVIIPFFQRLEQKSVLEGFRHGAEDFCQKIIKRAVTKREEMEEQEKVDLQDIPKEERVGPGGLDPLEVIETLPVELQEAFESRDVEQLKKVLMAMNPSDAEKHMKRCIDSGLWVDSGGN